MRRCLRPWILITGVLLAAATRAVAEPPLYRDTAEYAPFTLTWSDRADVKQARGVFPHPILPQRAALATDSGLFLTEDSGRTWSMLPAAATKAVGPIRDVAFHPLAVDTFYMASQTKGIWATTDNGKTFRPLGTKARGMASDTVVSLIVYPGDLARQTLLAVHGDAASGLSRSRDGGQSWDVLGRDYCFRRVLCGDEPPFSFYFLIGSTPKEPDIQNVYACSTVDDEFIIELVRDVVPTDMACAPKGGPIYLATSDSGLYRIDNTQFLPAVKPLGFKGVDGWASVGVTWGPNPDVVNLLLYDPSNLGLVVSSDDLASVHTASDGLLVSALVKEGAVIRPNANGTVFYAVANASLSIGRVPEEVPVVDLKPALFALAPRAESEPAWKELGDAFDKFSRAEGSTVAAAKALCQSVGDLQGVYHRCQLTVTARLPLKPSPPVSVTVDLSRFGGTPDTPLFDDGQHNDGAAGDGIYGGTFAFLPEMHPPAADEWRSSWPGRVALGVSATFADGRHEGAVGVVAVFARPSPSTK